MKLIFVGIFIAAAFIFACTATETTEDEESVTPLEISAPTKPLYEGNYCNPAKNPYCEIWDREPSEQLMIIFGHGELW